MPVVGWQQLKERFFSDAALPPCSRYQRQSGGIGLLFLIAVLRHCRKTGLLPGPRRSLVDLLLVGSPPCLCGHLSLPLVGAWLPSSQVPGFGRSKQAPVRGARLLIGEVHGWQFQEGRCACPVLCPTHVLRLHCCPGQQEV